VHRRGVTPLKEFQVLPPETTLLLFIRGYGSFNGVRSTEYHYNGLRERVRKSILRNLERYQALVLVIELVMVVGIGLGKSRAMGW
jgi:hypothetical protein